MSGLATSRRASLIRRLIVPMQPPLRHPHRLRLTNQSRPKSRAAAHRLADCKPFRSRLLLIIYCTLCAVPCPCRADVVPCYRSIIYTWRPTVCAVYLPVTQCGAWPGGLLISPLIPVTCTVQLCPVVVVMVTCWPQPYCSASTVVLRHRGA